MYVLKDGHNFFQEALKFFKPFDTVVKGAESKNGFGKRGSGEGIRGKRNVQLLNVKYSRTQIFR